MGRQRTAQRVQATLLLIQQLDLYLRNDRLRRPAAMTRPAMVYGTAHKKQTDDFRCLYVNNYQVYECYSLFIRDSVVGGQVAVGAVLSIVSRKRAICRRRGTTTRSREG